VRVTVHLDDDLHELARKAAAELEVTLSALIAEALRNALDATYTAPLPTVRGDGLMPGIDLDKSSSLLDV
jgi:hypothetical protein